MSTRGVLPIDPVTHRFGVSNTSVVLGLPNDADQWNASCNDWEGIGTQCSWDRFCRVVKFTKKKFPSGHPLHGADYVEPLEGEQGVKIVNALDYPCYQLRQRQFENLRGAGLRVHLGATGGDFIEAASWTFARGGLLILLTHFETVRGFEFTDGFLNLEEIRARRQPDGTGLFYAMTCDSGKHLRQMKDAICPLGRAYGSGSAIGAASTLLECVELCSTIITNPASFFEQVQVTLERLRGAGLTSGIESCRLRSN